MADSWDGRDFLGPKRPLFPDLTSEQRKQLDALEAEARNARARMLSFIYVVARQQREAGMPHDEIRREILSGLGDESAVLGIYFHESLVADVQNTIEDALDGRPPRLPEWVDPDAGAGGEPAP